MLPPSAMAEAEAAEQAEGTSDERPTKRSKRNEKDDEDEGNSETIEIEASATGWLIGKEHGGMAAMLVAYACMGR